MAASPIGTNDYLTVYDSTQAVQSVRDGLARGPRHPGRPGPRPEGLHGRRIREQARRRTTTPITAARLAKETGRPVKIVLTRRENSYCVGYRPSARMTVKAGVKKDGTLTALSLKSYNCGGIGRGDRIAAPFTDIYKCPNVKVEEFSVFTNTCGSRATRAPGHTQGTLGLEGFMEELAAALGHGSARAPAQELLASRTRATRARSTRRRASTSATRSARRGSAGPAGTRSRAAGRARSGPGSAWPARSGRAPGRRERWPTSRIYSDGSVEVECGTQDIGTGTRTHIAIVAADTLGLEPKDISVKIGNSDYPWAPNSGGSLTTPSVAPAVRDAALKAAIQLKALASKKLRRPGRRPRPGAKRRSSLKSDPAKAVELRELARGFRRPGRLPRRAGGHGPRLRLPDVRRPFRRGRGGHRDGQDQGQARRGRPRHRPRHQPPDRGQPGHRRRSPRA